MAGDYGFPIFTVNELQDRGVLLVEDGNHGEYRPRLDEFVTDGVAFIRAADMDGGRVAFGRASKINATAVERIRKGVGAPGDVLLSHKGTVGKVALVPPVAPSFVCSPQTTFWRSLNESMLDRGFLFAYLKSAAFQGQLAALKGETDMADYVSLTTQRGLRVPLPPIGVQRGIAGVLGALDDKIDLNRRTNETLEAIARGLFKSWFVDFDPVRAKFARRLSPGMDATTAALLPDHFDESDLGEIPAGWAVLTFRELSSSILSGGTPTTTTAEFWGGGIPWFSSGETREPFVVRTEKTITQRGVDQSSTRLARAGATVVAGAGQGKTRGQASLLMLDTYVNQSVVVLMANPERTSDEWLFFDISRRYEQFRALSDSHSSRGSLTTALIAQVKTVVPPRPVVGAFDVVAAPVVRKIRTNLLESQTLAELRDMLLPKLLSGELRVREAEGIVDRAV